MTGAAGSARSTDDPHYLAKDFASFREMMLGELARRLPDGVSDDPASLELTLVEVLAYVADYLSYYQDAVATEAYLSTARRRVSVARHARLVGYDVNEGCSARVLVHVETAADDVELAAGTVVATRLDGIDRTRIAPADLGPESEAFETIHAITLMRGHNRMPLVGAAPSAGATSAALAGRLPGLRPGDLLILGHAEEEWSHPIRLVDVRMDRETTAIAWHDQDAIPATAPTGGRWTALGNIVLADHGLTSHLPLHSFRDAETTIACPRPSYVVPLARDTGGHTSAASLFELDPREAQPTMMLIEALPVAVDDGAWPRPRWHGRRHLLSTAPGERVFAVEPVDPERINLRFDATRRPPGHGRHTLRYRTGQGLRGTIGARAIGHVVTGDERLVAVTNPLAAAGGADPEPIERIRAAAPASIDRVRRCVTPADYAAVASAVPGVEAATAGVDATGRLSLHALATPGAGVDEAIRRRILAHLDPLRMVGEPIEVVIVDPVVPLVALEVAATGAQTDAIAAAVRSTLPRVLRPGFGEPLTAVAIIAAVSGIDGIGSVALTGFSRDGAADAVVASLSVAPDAVIRLEPTRIAVTLRHAR